MSRESPAVGYSPAQLDLDQVDALLRSAPEQFSVPVYVDLNANKPKSDQTRGQFREMLQDKFDLKLAHSVERLWDLPPVILQRSNDEYVNLLVEARELFTIGYFYSCVAMCGIVGEKLVKDVLRDSILTMVDGVVERPIDEAFDQFERVDVSSIIRFLNRARLLTDDVRRAADDLIILRNQYAHARGKNPEVDALQAIKRLHILVEGTVSLLKDYEISEGMLRPKKSS